MAKWTAVVQVEGKAYAHYLGWMLIETFLLFQCVNICWNKDGYDR